MFRTILWTSVAALTAGVCGAQLVQKSPGLVGKRWEEDRRLTRDDAASLTSINFARNVAADDAGRVYVAWSDARDGNEEIYVKRSPDGGLSWGPPVRLSADPGDSKTPSIAADGDAVHVVWYDFRAGFPRIWSRRSLDGGLQWEPEVAVTQGDGAHPSVAARQTSVHVSFVSGRDGQSEVYHARSLDGGAVWQPERRLSDLADNSWTPTIALEGSNVYVAWTDTRHGPPQSGEEEYFKRSLDDGATWGPDTRLTFDPANSWAPSLAASGADVWIVWFDERGGNWDVYTKRSQDFGATWSRDRRLTFDPGTSVRPSIAVVGSSLHVVWWDTRDGNAEIYAKRSLDRGVSWSGDLRLTEALGSSTLATVAASPAGVFAVWEETRNGNAEVYFKRLPRKRVGVGNGRLAYSRPVAGSQQIFTVLPDGSGEQQLTNVGDNTYPAWSRDGTRIAFASSRSGGFELWMMDADGASQIQLTFDGILGGGNFVPDWSYDGTRIAYASVQSDVGFPEVWVMSSDGTSQTRLTFTPLHPGTFNWSLLPTWSPDDERIYYASTASGSSQIWGMFANGMGQHQKTNGLGPGYPDANAPDWSRDGSKIVFWSGFEGQFGEVWTMDPSGANPMRLTDTPDPMNSDNPAWAPDGTRILFDSNRAGPVDVWCMDADGSNVVLQLPGVAGQTSWQPVFAPPN